MDLTIAIGQAIALRHVANELQQSLNQVAPQGGSTVTDPTLVTQMTGYFFSTVILRALATELLLKALSFRRTGTYERTHDLLDLFNALDSDTRNIITTLEGVHGIAPLERILEKHRGDFVEWRHLMEGGDHDTGLLDLDKALTILIAVYNHQDFIRLCS